MMLTTEIYIDVERARHTDDAYYRVPPRDVGYWPTSVSEDEF